MTKTLWIHAGFPKCGSSAIQVFMARNREMFLKEGLDYLLIQDLSKAKMGKITSGNADQIAKLLRSDEYQNFYNTKNELHKNFFNIIYNTNAQQMLISSEFFASVPIKRFSDLRNILNKNNIEVKIIYYVRRQDQFLMSAYMQAVKRHRYTHYPEDFVKETIDNRILKYNTITSKFKNIFGNNNVLTYVYENTKQNKYGIIGHLVKVLFNDYLPSWVKPIEPINTSPSAHELKFMLFANKYKPRMRFSDILVENSILSSRSKEYQVHNLLPLNTIDYIINYFNNENTDFIKEHSLNGDFPIYNMKEIEYINLRDISYSVDEVLDIITGYLVNFDKRLNSLETKQ